MMNSGDNRPVARAATLVMAMGLLAGTAMTASAADLGGDCCADLEERVAELEATSVKHANRKISLTISGRVSEAVLYWNDGEKSDLYVVEADTQAARLTLAGKGKITADLQAGYTMTIRANMGRMSKQNQTYVADDKNLSISDQNVYIDSKSMGKLTMGYGSNSYRSFSGGGVDLGGPSAINATNDPAAWVPKFTVGTKTWDKVLSTYAVDRGMSIRYDSPSLAGFVVSASWGDDDVSSATLTYDSKFGDIQVKAGAGVNVAALEGADDDTRYTLAGSVYDAKSGLFGFAEYNVRTANAGLGVHDDATNLYLKGGWRQDVTGLGQTALYAEWAKSDGVSQKLVGTTVEKTVGTMFGAGVSQELSAVGASVYLNYRHLSVDDQGAGAGVVGCGPTSTANCDDIDTVLAGMIVTF